MVMRENVGLTYYYPNFINEEEQFVIKNWALRNRQHFIKNTTGPFRVLANFNSIPEKLDLISTIKNRIIDVEELSGKYWEPVIKDFVSIHENGAKVPEHTDTNPVNTDYYSVRYNVFITLPEIGGLPIYGNEILQIKERCLLRVDAGLIPHSTTLNEGETPRIILSYGFVIKK